MSFCIERLLGQFSTSSAYLPVTSCLSPSLHLYHLFTPRLSPCLFVFSLRGVNPDWVILPLHTASSSFLALSFPLLYNISCLCMVWKSARDSQYVMALICPGCPWLKLACLCVYVQLYAQASVVCWREGTIKGVIVHSNSVLPGQ